MDTPIKEQEVFQNVTSNIAASEHEITEPNTLSVDFINYVSKLDLALMIREFFKSFYIGYVSIHAFMWESFNVYKFRLRQKFQG